MLLSFLLTEILKKFYISVNRFDTKALLNRLIRIAGVNYCQIKYFN